MRARTVLISCALCCAGTLGCGSAEPVAPENPASAAIELQLTTNPFRVDRIFKSMRGPVFTRHVKLQDPAKPELLWLTGYAMEVVSPDGRSPVSIEFECHTNVNWLLAPQWSHRNKPRIFTLTQGQTDVRVPAGFGLPILSSETLSLSSQVLNLNQPEIDRMVAHRLRLRYVRDRDLVEPMKPLIATNAQVMVSLEDEGAVWNVASPGEHLEGASCAPGEFAGGGSTMRDRFGRRFTPHWVVPPGRHEYRTLVTDKMDLPYDTTVHFIGVHVHPYSVSLELRDLTSGEAVFVSRHRTHEDRIGLEHLDAFSSEEGVPVYRDHDYELISVYDNPTDRDSDAMASMFIYYLDKEFAHPLAGVASRI